VRCTILTVLLVFTHALLPANEEGIKSSTDLQLQISSAPEAKLSLNQQFIFPFLQGSGPLTTDNNIALNLSAEVTPVSMDGFTEISWTPAAFFVLSGGGLLYSGWNIFLGNGIGINAPIDEGAAPPREAKIFGSAFDGLVWQTWGAGTAQFDLGAVIPGDWTHVLFLTRQEFRYSAYTRAGPHDAWIFENDDGENMNGWYYYARYVLGYSMPRSPVLDTIALMAEMKKFLYNTPNGDFWGENLGEWTFSGILNFSINPRFSTTVTAQVITRRNHGISNFYNKDYYYQDFELLKEGGKRRLIFYRAAAVLNFKIR